jgi:predicted  nucleic acid-binding Zn-ribbon protein
VISGCAKQSDINDLQKQIDDLKSSDQIQTISGQITSINNSLTSLQNTDSQLKGYIETLQGQAESLEAAGKNLEDAIAKMKEELKGEISAAESDAVTKMEEMKSAIDDELETIKKAIEALQVKDNDLQKQIDDLKVYAETQIGEIKDWAEATSATLEEYNKTAAIVAGIPVQIENLNNEIAEIKENISDVKTELGEAISQLKTELQGETDEAVAALKEELLTKIKDASDDAAKAIESATEEITKAYKTAISEAIDASEESMKAWINEQLTGYYTIAQMDTKLGLLEDKLDAQKKDLKELIDENADGIEKNKGDIEKNTQAINDLKASVDENAQDISDLTDSLAAQKTAITTAYTKAIASAVENQGTINKTVQDTLAKHNSRLIALDSRVTQCETDIAAIKDEITKIKSDIADLQKDVKGLLSRVQSITYIPKYSDGIERVEYDESTATATDLTLRFDVRPADCADSIVKAYEKYLKDQTLASPLKARAVYTLTKAAAAGDFVDLKINDVTAEKDESTNKTTGVLSVTISPANLGTEFFQGTLGASLVLSVSTGSTDIQSDYIRLTLSSQNSSKLTNYYSTIPFTIQSFGVTYVSLVKDGTPADITLEYRKNAEEWAAYSIGTEISLVGGNTLQLRAGEGGNSKFSKDVNNRYKIQVTNTGSVNVYGNIMSLLDKNLSATSVPEGCFCGLFGKVDKLISAANLQLPASELSEYCYSYMFSGCTSLTVAPELPATTLAEYCYDHMFYNCTSLTVAPELPATTLAKYCYSNMFSKCTSLAVAPELPAISLAECCYDHMFYRCSLLSSVKAMFKNTPNNEYSESWLYKVSSIGIFIKNKDATWDVTGDSAIPSGWTVVTE